MTKETCTFRISIEDVKYISFDRYDKNFTFIVDSKRYTTSRVLADLISPIVNKYHYDDETINEIIIQTKHQISQISSKEGNNPDYFSDFLKLFTFEEQAIDEAHRQHYLEYFLQLGNINEYLRLQPKYLDELTPENIIDRLQFFYRQTQHQGGSEVIDGLLTYASSNFESISKEEVKKLSIENLEMILNKATLKLKNEDTLLDFIVDLYREDTRYSVLFEYVQFNNVKEKTLEKFINEFDIEFMNSKIWRRICERLLPLNRSEQDECHIIEKEHKEGDEFNGLLRYLSERTGGNIHDNGTVDITFNSIISDRCHPKNLVNYQNNESNFYQSKVDKCDVYVSFDLKDRQIQLTSYSIKSFAGGQNWCNLKNWKVEVSNDGKKWTTIDEHSNDSTLNGSRAIGTFKIKQETEFYRFIQLHQTGQNWANDNYMIFYCLEFYGKLKEQKKE